MKLTMLLLMVTLVLIRTEGYGQITLKEKNAPLEKVLAAIEKQTKYVFLYDPDDLKVGPVTIDVKNVTIQETLGTIFKGKPVEFTVLGNNVLLKKRLSRDIDNAINADVNISGKVVDENGQPLPGVTVLNKRETKAAETDSNGIFIIPATRGDIVSFSFVGLKEQEVRLTDQRHIHITLEINPSSPEQVVVIGYGSSKRKDLTGSVSTIDRKSMDELPFNTIDNALAGKAAGVQVTKSDGTPGGMARVRVRGFSSVLGGNDPLYVIDGIPVQVRNNFIDPGFQVSSPAANLVGAFSGSANGAAISAYFVNGLNSLGGLNPDDIESITVLKDASSTAIYGSKAANGVVIITTKEGNKNTLPQVAVNYYSTIISPYKTPKLLNASEYKSLLTEAAQNTYNDDTAHGSPVDPVASAVLGNPSYFGTVNTDWIKKVTRTTNSNNIGLSVSGGGHSSRYFSSIAYSKTPGVVDGTDLRRISGKLNLQTEISPQLTFVTNLLLGFTDQNITTGAYTQALLARPDWTPRDSAGNYTDLNLQGRASYGFLNPAALVTATNNARTLTLLGSASGAYAISKALRFRSTLSINMQNYNQRNFLPGYIDISGTYGNTDNTGAIGSNVNSRFADWFLENTLSYTKQFNAKHAVNVVIGQSYETTKYSYYRATASGYPNNTTLTGLSSASTPLSVAGDDPRSPQSYLLSFYARTNYSYLDKYLFTFTGRTDGSSKFGPDNKYGYFPSGAVAWRLSREDFLKDVGWINDLKLRGSYGLTGNQNIGDQMYRTLYSSVSYGGSSALIPTQLGNQGIKWESTKEADLGLDLSLFAGRLYATADYYNRHTNDGLLPVSVPVSSSYITILKNAIEIRNRGLEISVGGDIIRTRDFRWSSSVNITWNNSLVTRLDPRAILDQLSPTGLESIGEASAQNYTNSTNQNIGNTALIEGKPLGVITGRVITGLVKNQAQLDAYNSRLGYNTYFYARQIGDPMYRLDTSLASVGYVAPAAAQAIGNGAPKYYGGMTQELSYKNFDLQLYLTFSGGGHLLWAEHVASTEFYGTGNAGHSMLDRYTPSNNNSGQPRLTFNSSPYFATNSDVFGSSYLKLRSLTFNYHFPQAGWMKMAGMSSLQVFISATNVFTITKYPGSDPETSDDPYSVSGGYLDAGNYPATRTFSLGLKTVF